MCRQKTFKTKDDESTRHHHNDYNHESDRREKHRRSNNEYKEQRTHSHVEKSPPRDEIDSKSKASKTSNVKYDTACELQLVETIPNALKKGHHAKRMVVEHQTIFEVNLNFFLIFNQTIQRDSLGMDGTN